MACSADKIKGGRAYDERFCECSGVADEHATFFACSSFEQQPQRMGLIYASRVGDGVCDCCDGSDEAGKLCPNSCLSNAATRETYLQQSASMAEAIATNAADAQQFACVRQRLRSGQRVHIGAIGGSTTAGSTRYTNVNLPHKAQRGLEGWLYSQRVSATPHLK